MHDLGTLGGTSSQGLAINNNNNVTGFSHNADGESHAFFYDSTTMIDLGTLGGNRSVGRDVNDSGNVVGQSRTISGVDEAFLWTVGDGMLNLNDLIDPDDPLVGQFFFRGARGINSSGSIIVDAFMDGQIRAVLLNPIQPVSVVPESSALTLFIFGLAGLGFARRRRSVDLPPFHRTG